MPTETDHNIEHPVEHPKQPEQPPFTEQEYSEMLRLMDAISRSYLSQYISSETSVDNRPLFTLPPDYNTKQIKASTLELTPYHREELIELITKCSDFIDFHDRHRLTHQDRLKNGTEVTPYRRLLYLRLREMAFLNDTNNPNGPLVREVGGLMVGRVEGKNNRIFFNNILILSREIPVRNKIITVHTGFRPGSWRSPSTEGLMRFMPTYAAYTIGQRSKEDFVKPIETQANKMKYKDGIDWETSFPRRYLRFSNLFHHAVVQTAAMNPDNRDEIISDLLQRELLGNDQDGNPLFSADEIVQVFFALMNKADYDADRGMVEAGIDFKHAVEIITKTEKEFRKLSDPRVNHMLDITQVILASATLRFRTSELTSEAVKDISQIRENAFQGLYRSLIDRAVLAVFRETNESSTIFNRLKLLLTGKIDKLKAVNQAIKQYMPSVKSIFKWQEALFDTMQYAKNPNNAVLDRAVYESYQDNFDKTIHEMIEQLINSLPPAFKNALPDNSGDEVSTDAHNYAFYKLLRLYLNATHTMPKQLVADHNKTFGEHLWAIHTLFATSGMVDSAYVFKEILGDMAEFIFKHIDIDNLASNRRLVIEEDDRYPGIYRMTIVDENGNEQPLFTDENFKRIIGAQTSAIKAGTNPDKGFTRRAIHIKTTRPELMPKLRPKNRN